MLKLIWFLPPVIQSSAARHGFLDREGVKVEATATRSSDEQFEGLRDGRFDAAVTSMDNVIMWNKRPGGGDFRIIAQIETSTGNTVVAQNHFDSLKSLEGHDLLVDSAQNGFVIVLLAMLADAGVDLSTCRLVESGGVQERFDKLVSGEGNAGLLGPPFVEMALANGLKNLGEADDLYPDFPGQGIVVRQSTIDAKGEELARWLAALDAGRAECVRDRVGTAAMIAAQGLPQPVADRLAGYIGESLTPTAKGVELLIKQRRQLGLPGGDDSLETLVDLRPLAWSAERSGSKN